MASIGWLGFAKGASKAGLDAIVSREEEEAKKKLLDLQEKLRRETSEIEFKRDVKREIDKEERALTRPKDNILDPVSGKVRIVDSMGRQVSEREAAQSELEEYNLKKQEGLLGLDVKRANINQSNASADASRASAGYSRKAASQLGLDGSGGGSTGGNVSFEEAAQTLVDSNPTIFKQMIDLGYGAEDVLRAAGTAARKAAAFQKQGKKVNAQQQFLETARKLREAALDAKKKKKDWALDRGAVTINSND